jgi:hypothetical protein
MALSSMIIIKGLVLFLFRLAEVKNFESHISLRCEVLFEPLYMHMQTKSIGPDYSYSETSHADHLRAKENNNEHELINCITHRIFCLRIKQYNGEFLSASGLSGRL